jgi:hypothetical protein
MLSIRHDADMREGERSGGYDAEKKIWSLKGSISIKKHLKHLKTGILLPQIVCVTEKSTEENTLSLSLSVKEFQVFSLRIGNTEEKIIWRDLLSDIIAKSETE